MKIRKAEKKDIPRILALLGQVLQIHAEEDENIAIIDEISDDSESADDGG